MVQTVIKTGFLCMVREESEDYLIIDWAVTGVKVAPVPDNSITLTGEMENAIWQNLKLFLD